MKRNELILLVLSTLVAVLLGLGAIRWLAPGLLGAPRDLQLVQSAEQVPAFFEGVFRPEQFRTVDFFLKDPRTVNRPRPFHGEVTPAALGPHDALGFRNRQVPAVADVVAIGDSQTYGFNVLLEDNWPARLAAGLPGRTVYSMAVGSWGAVQYTDMFLNAGAFRPRVVVVAFYSGNDALESFSVAYSSDLWRELRPDPALGPSDAPAVTFPPPESEWWRAHFAGGTVAFTPRLRLPNNRAHPAVDAGYGVMQRAAKTMAAEAARQGFAVAFTVIPTKELVYAPRVAAERLDAPPEYAQLIAAEQARIATLARDVGGLPGATYVDVVGSLQAAARTQLDLYPSGPDGHPLESGYRIIADALARSIGALLAPPPEGWVQIATDPEGREGPLFLVRDGTAWLFPTLDLARANGWRDIRPRPVTARELATLPKRTAQGVDRTLFGPRPARSGSR